MQLFVRHQVLMVVRYPDYHHLGCDTIQFGTCVPALPIFKEDMSITLKMKHQTALKMMVTCLANCTVSNQR
jgi:hypothetical protein